jgi:hypothetical protein
MAITECTLTKVELNELALEIIQFLTASEEAMLLYIRGMSPEQLHRIGMFERAMGVSILADVMTSHSVATLEKVIDIMKTTMSREAVLDALHYNHYMEPVIPFRSHIIGKAYMTYGLDTAKYLIGKYYNSNGYYITIPLVDGGNSILTAEASRNYTSNGDPIV